MGLFSSDHETCAVCGKDIKLSFLSKSGFKLLDGKFICVDCAKQYGINPLGDNNTTLAAVEKRKAGLALIKNGEFHPTQNVNRTTLFGVQTEFPVLQLDEANGLINLPILIYGLSKDTQVDNVKPVNKILNFELLEDGNSVANGNSIIRAGVGAALFGGAGAIVGAGTNAKTIKKVCKSLKIKVTFDDIDDPVTYIDLLGKQLNGGAKTDGAEYKGAFSTAQKCMSILSILIERNSKKENTNDKADTKDTSVADEILKFKQLLDMGAITQEEFDAKKKKLLDL